jgi:hypothetical protein
MLLLDWYDNIKANQVLGGSCSLGGVHEVATTRPAQQLFRSCVRSFSFSQRDEKTTLLYDLTMFGGRARSGIALIVGTKRDDEMEPACGQVQCIGSL